MLCTGITGLARKPIRGHPDFHPADAGGSQANRDAAQVSLKLFDKLGWWNEIVEDLE